MAEKFTCNIFLILSISCSNKNVEYNVTSQEIYKEFL